MEWPRIELASPRWQASTKPTTPLTGVFYTNDQPWFDDLDSWGWDDPYGFISLNFRKLSSVLSPKLSRIYHHLFENRLFLDGQRTGNIVPLSKDVLSSDCNNYCRITILPILPKVSEKLFFLPFYKYLKTIGFYPLVNRFAERSWIHVMYYLTFHLWCKRSLIKDKQAK